MGGLRIVALEGDQTGQELLEQALRVLDPELLGIEHPIVQVGERIVRIDRRPGVGKQHHADRHALPAAGLDQRHQRGPVRTRIRSVRVAHPPV